MKKTSWKAFMDYEKEEKWLNEMSAKGLAMTDYVLCRYTFEDCAPGEYVYRIELLDNLPSSAESQKYLDFMAENGVENVASWVRWVYFRRKADRGPFDIYSDIDSRIKHYKRIMTLWLPAMFVELICAIIELLANNLVLSAVLFVIFVVIFVHWNAVRKNVKKLRTEKQLRE